MNQTPLKILLCCPLPWVDTRFGASRVAIDLADGFRNNNIEYTFYPASENQIERLDYPDVLADYLIDHAHEFDVVDYPFHVRPWIKDAGNVDHVLKVARVVLLPHFEDSNPDPAPPETWIRKSKKLVKRLIGKPEPTLYSPKIREAMDRNMAEADLINVANSADKACLVPLGFDAAKILVLPYGLTRDGAKRLLPCIEKRDHNSTLRVGFVGTFDFRKGCLDFPDIVSRVVSEVPGVKFRLLGTKGMMQTKEKVLQWFPKQLHKNLEIYPTFDPEELPSHLAECHVGMFPSYREGFGIAVVEKLGAGLPVIAYNAPGPCDILPSDWLVQPGEKLEMADKIIELLTSKTPEQAGDRALQRSKDFDWDKIALQTLESYQMHLSKIRASSGDRHL